MQMPNGKNSGGGETSYMFRLPISAYTASYYTGKKKCIEIDSLRRGGVNQQ